jgi:hypothetical protein
VQHSLDGTAWETLGFVQGVGVNGAPQNYGYLHAAPVQGPNYYRLRMVDQDGHDEFSEVKTIDVAGADELATIFPNPTNGHFEVRSIGRKGQLEVTDMLGRFILRSEFDNQLELDLGDQAPGVYWIKIVDQDQHSSMQRLVLQYAAQRPDEK